METLMVSLFLGMHGIVQRPQPPSVEATRKEQPGGDKPEKSGDGRM